MPRRKTIDEKVALNMTPMIDVTFQLLIFFIVTMKFRLLEKKLVTHLPTDFGSRTDAREIDENFVLLSLRQRADRPGLRSLEQATEFLIEGEVIAPDEIVARLEGLRRSLGEPVGKIRVGPGVPHGQVVRALDGLSAAGFERVAFQGLAGLGSGPEFEAFGRRLRRDLAEVLR